MKRVIAFYTTIVLILLSNIVFDYFKTEKVLLVGELIGFEVSTEKSNSKDGNVIPTSYNTLGTMSFIKESTNEFVALGHPSIDTNANSDLNAECYPIKFMIVNKSSKDKIGSLIGLPNKDEKIGNIYKDTNYGLIGKVYNLEKQNYQEIELISRYRIKKGKANILNKFDGENLESYEVEIVDINYADRNMNINIEITDDKLIEKTGGIVQGMSGTPLVQGGKLIGIVNYVEEKDSTRAYAIFADKLI